MSLAGTKSGVVDRALLRTVNLDEEITCPTRLERER